GRKRAEPRRTAADRQGREKEIISQPSAKDSQLPYVSSSQNLQKRGKGRLPLRQRGGGPADFHRHETRQEVARGADRLYRDRQVARRFRRGRSSRSSEQSAREWWA